MVSNRRRARQIVVFLIVVSGFSPGKSERISNCLADEDEPWSYDKNLRNAPSNWGTKYPDCYGIRQSPINIDPRKVVNSAGPRRLSLTNYDRPVTSALIENFGYRVDVIPTDNEERSVLFNGTSYSLTHLHLHWGNQTSKGSEHQINGSQYTMETQLMHRNADGGVLAIGYFLSESNRNNPAIGSLLSLAPYITYKYDEYDGPLPQPMALEDLVRDGCNFYRYEGSMTFPPCTPGVTWLICKSDGQVSSAQLRQLFLLYRAEKDSDVIENCHLVNNYRPIQPLYYRSVYE